MPQCVVLSRSAISEFRLALQYLRFFLGLGVELRALKNIRDKCPTAAPNTHILLVPSESFRFEKHRQQVYAICSALCLHHFCLLRIHSRLHGKLKAFDKIIRPYHVNYRWLY